MIVTDKIEQEVDGKRKELIERSRRIVVKVGTNVLTDQRGVLCQHRIESLVEQLNRIHGTGKDLVLVSSGAIGTGMGCLNLKQRPTDLPHLQACAAVGQSLLIQRYRELFAPFAIHPAQILLTAGDLENRTRYLNVRNTLLTLFEYRCLPIINENDTVSVKEICFGDNDYLSALVSDLLQADLLILLTNVAGLYSVDPNSKEILQADSSELPKSDLLGFASKDKSNSNREEKSEAKIDQMSYRDSAQLISEVPYLDQKTMELAGLSKSQLGTGGMRSKLKAVRLAVHSGTAVIMADGSAENILDTIWTGKTVGTYFHSNRVRLSARKRWFGFFAYPVGEYQIDAGAKKAILEKGKSLLPIGVIHVVGQFKKGAVVRVVDPEGKEIARGLSNYSSEIAVQFCRKSTDEIESRFGTMLYGELIHRDNLTLIEEN